MAILLSGAPVAAALREKSLAQAEVLRRQGIIPCLAILCIGDRPDAASYAASLMKNAPKSGVETRWEEWPESISPGEALARILRLNRDPLIHGILLLRPLPPHLDEEALCQAIAPEKDVDCATDLSLAGVFAGKKLGFPPATPRAVMEILRFYNIPLAGKKAVVLGRSLVVGRPLALLLLARNATVTVCHSRTGAEEIRRCSRQAQIVAACLGRAEMVDAGFLSEGQIVLDVGINPTPEGGIVGDVRFAEAEPLAEAITPVPGGVGTVTTSVLAKHVILAAARQNGIEL